MTGEDPVAAAAELSESFKAMTTQMARLARRGKRDRRVIIGLLISICLDLLITAGLGYNTFRQIRAEDTLAATQSRSAPALSSSVRSPTSPAPRTSPSGAGC